MTPAELEEHKAGLKLNLGEIERQLALCPHLFVFLKKDWATTVTANIDSMKANLAIGSAAHYLFRTFWGEKGLLQKIEDGLALIEPLARKNGKLDSYRETGIRLATKTMEQIEPAIFEILVLRGLIRAASKAAINIELYPNMADGKSNIEVRLWIDRRWCNIEAKILGYPNNIPSIKGNRVFTHSIERLTVPITHALTEKTSSGKQLACVPVGESAVVFLAQKENIHDRAIARGIAHEFLTLESTSLSAVLLFGSAFSRTAPDLVAATEGTAPLTSTESEFLKGIYGQISASAQTI